MSLKGYNYYYNRMSTDLLLKSVSFAPYWRNCVTPLKINRVRQHYNIKYYKIK